MLGATVLVVVHAVDPGLLAAVFLAAERPVPELARTDCHAQPDALTIAEPEPIAFRESHPMKALFALCLVESFIGAGAVAAMIFWAIHALQIAAACHR